MDKSEEYIIDFVSGAKIRSTPEEVDAVQAFSRQLVEDYGYPKNNIQTRPQFRVKARPSDMTKEYPVDIAVFSSNMKIDENLYIIVECKKKNRRDGRTQLEDYMRLSRAKMGVWFNGEERLFLKKIEQNGQVTFKEIPNIPKYGQRLEDIGKFKRKDLRPPHSLRLVFKAIRSHLAGNFTGATRDEELARELINLVFCKIYDEKFTRPEDEVEFRVGDNESPQSVKKRIFDIFEKVKEKYAAVIDFNDEIKLDPKAIVYVVGELQNYCLMDAERDAVADAFETFIGYALKGSQGQFFTPRNVVRLMVKIASPSAKDVIIDPACGSGGFLVESLRYVWQELEHEGKEYGWSELALIEEKTAVATKNINGIEKDNFLSKVAKAYMAILGDGKGGIFCEDSLEKPSNWKNDTQQTVALGKYDLILTNPPFGKDIKIDGADKLGQYDLGFQWKDINGEAEKTNKIKKEENPQILFIERSLQLLRDGGKLGIILPETFFHAPKIRYVLNYMLRNNNIQWIIDLPHNTFRPHNNAKCIIIILEKNKRQQSHINMAVAEQIGHNHQGKPIYRWDKRKNNIDKGQLWDDIPLILDEISNGFSKYCFRVSAKEVLKRRVLVPRYYWNNKMEEIKKDAQNDNCQLISIQQLIDEGIIEYFDGHGSPESEYKGMGEVPYIRVKDIVNWEIYKDPTSKIPEDVYLAKKGKAKDIKEYDIVYVRRGSYRIGSVAMVSAMDEKVLLTREILIFRLRDGRKYNLNPFYLLYLLSHRLVSEQTNNKVLIETTLPNISDRWKEIYLPISNSRKDISYITEKVEKAIRNKWAATAEIDTIKRDLGSITT